VLRAIAVSIMFGVAVAADEAVRPILELVRQAQAAGEAGDKAAWMELARAAHERAPEHPNLMIGYARALAAAGRADEALPYLEQAVARGAGFELAAYPEFTEASAGSAYQVLAGRARANLAPVAPPEAWLVIEDTGIQPEGIAWDGETSMLYISSFNREIWRVTPDRRLTRFAGAEAGLRQVAGLKVDRKRRLLWAASGVFPGTQDPSGEADPEVGRTALLAFDLDTGERRRHCVLDERPVPHGFNDLALAENGDVFASDSLVGAIYRLRPADCRFERVIQDPHMGFPNGIALSADESRLYVAHIEGLSAVDLATGARSQLPVPAGATVNSMDGLVRDGADLIGVQPTPLLARVLRIRLDEGGRAIRSVETVSSRPPGGAPQATGTVAGTRYYSVAGPLGPPQPGDDSDRRARILRSDL
jgi:sugar lactone lactonase YvrE